MKPRILILDDESGICISLALALQNEYDAQGETDPIKALDRLSVEPFDVVLLDLCWETTMVWRSWGKFGSWHPGPWSL